MVAIAGAGVRRASTALPWYWCSGGGGARCAGERSGQLGRRTQRGEQEIRNNTVGWRPSGGRVSRRAGPDGPAPDEEASAGAGSGPVAWMIWRRETGRVPDEEARMGARASVGKCCSPLVLGRGRDG